MSFDPTKPLPNSAVTSAELRNQFNGLKYLIDTIPVGPPGPQGPPGEVTNAQLADAINGTSASCNGVGLMDFTISDPPTQWEVGTIYNKVNELIQALHRV